MAINAYFRSFADRAVVPVSKALVQTGVRANTLTAVGLAGVVAGAGLVALGRPAVGAVVLAVATGLDAVDGTVARLTDSESTFGAFYDSVADRVADSIILGVCAWTVRDQPDVLGLMLLAFATALITSYVRAKAEAVGFSATVGLIERPERMAIAVIAIGFDAVTVGAWVLAIGGTVTVIQRIWTVTRQAKQSSRPSQSPSESGLDDVTTQ